MFIGSWDFDPTERGRERFGSLDEMVGNVQFSISKGGIIHVDVYLSILRYNCSRLATRKRQTETSETRKRKEKELGIFLGRSKRGENGFSEIYTQMGV